MDAMRTADPGYYSDLVKATKLAHQARPACLPEGSPAFMTKPSDVLT